MFSVLIAIVLFLACILGVHWLLKSMAADGVEAAAPGSCKSGSCGVRPRQPDETAVPAVRAQFVRVEAIERNDTRLHDRHG